MLTVIETHEFVASAQGVWGEDERYEFIDWIAGNPNAGDVIPHAGNLRKVRWKRAGMGKRGGARVIYFVRSERGEIVLITVYAKGNIENIPARLLRALSEKYHAPKNEC
jgi:mRNA-degrading endonuclease RelE of RelBE toxin-antitoxin system